MQAITLNPGSPGELASAKSQAQPRTTLPAVPVAANPATRSAKDSQESIRAAVRAANEAIHKISTGVEFSLDDATGRTVVRVIDTETNEILRQIPSKEILAIARAIDNLQGLLVDQEA